VTRWTKRIIGSPQWVIDGVDQLEWLTGHDQHSARDGYIYWMRPDIYDVKWRDFKLVLVAQKYSADAPARLASPHVINLITDPQSVSPFRICTPGRRRISTGCSTSSVPALPGNRSPRPGAAGPRPQTAVRAYAQASARSPHRLRDRYSCFGGGFGEAGVS
jgi:hypothetical protein